VLIAAVLVLGWAAPFGLVALLPRGGGAGFYAVMAHNLMVAIFLPALLLPMASIGIGLVRCWREVGQAVRASPI
jgi:citrate/tricarballylate utilization protein